MARVTTPPSSLKTSRGTLRLPAYIPVTTFGERYPLDELVRPYLPRLAPAVMVSLYYARQMKERPPLPLFVDSGGFASLFEGASVRKAGTLGTLCVPREDGMETMHPTEVLEFQEQHADVAFTLDFPVPPSMEKREARRRVDLTVANAHWALANRRRKDLLLFACVQGWDEGSYRACAEAYASSSFDGVAIGGLIPRAHDRAKLLRIVDAVRAAVPDKPLHVFGLGKPELVGALFERGVQSVDSSSYVKLAADGRLWGQPSLHLANAAPVERLQLALLNLATATQRTLPLSFATSIFGSRLWERSASVANEGAT